MPSSNIWKLKGYSTGKLYCGDRSFTRASWVISFHSFGYNTFHTGFRWLLQHFDFNPLIVYFIRNYSLSMFMLYALHFVGTTHLLHRYHVLDFLYEFDAKF